jgi:hypothetical protein
MGLDPGPQARHARPVTAPVDQFIQSAVKARQRAQTALTSAVLEARSADWSWDRISAALGGSPSPETLQRAFGIAEAAPDRATDGATDGATGCGGGCACAGCGAS